MPRTVLKERYESAPEEDEVAHDESGLEHDEVGKCLFGVLFTNTTVTNSKAVCSCIQMSEFGYVQFFTKLT